MPALLHAELVSQQRDLEVLRALGLPARREQVEQQGDRMRQG